MKSLYLPLLTAVLFLAVSSCQKEISNEISTPAAGSLQSSSGECMPKLVSGIYVAGRNLTDSNFIEVEVNVTVPGSYTIYTDTTNGYFFNGEGVFTSTGAARLKLTAKGKPLSAGTDGFVVKFGSTICYIDVPVLPAGGGSAAVYSLEGAGSSCSNFSLAGAYTRGVALTLANTVSLEVNVTTVGAYSITTNTVNGYKFSGSGAFTTTGKQMVSLAGSGTPVNEGSNQFTVTAGSATCTFNVIVTTTSNPVVETHFPLSLGSWWSYFDPNAGPADSTKRTIIDSVLISSMSYKRFEDRSPDTTSHSYYRRIGNDYFEYAPVDAYALDAWFEPAILGDILFLKETVTVGQSWTVGPWTGHDEISDSVIRLRYIFTCTAVNTTVTAGNRTFTNVHKISFKSQTAPATGGSFTDSDFVWEMWYAKGIGLVFIKVNMMGAPVLQVPVSHWKVF